MMRVGGVENRLRFSNARWAAFCAVHGAGTSTRLRLRDRAASRVDSERMAVITHTTSRRRTAGCKSRLS
jgi:hypothetical protein